jgi:gamma-glutamyltranspeptidase/glutathione hydrolase
VTVERYASGRRFAIATPHAAATRAGASAFDAGGNALDAALAAATTLAVVYPHMCGVGGDLFALVQHPTGDVLAIQSAGRAPAGIDPDVVRAQHGDRMPEHGPFTVTVPGAVAGWRAVHDRGARLPWSDAFAAASAAAHDGVPVARSLAGSIGWRSKELAADPGLRAIVFDADGQPLAEGDRLVQPALGATLEALAAEGPDALYRGELGRRYAAGLREAGVPITPEDLERHEPILLSPLAGRYRDLDVRVSPPTSQGFVLLEILEALERLGVDPDPLGPDAGTLALLFRAASLDRDLHLADPDHLRVHPHALLDDGHLAALVDEVRSGRPVPVDLPAPSVGGTIGLAAADAEGYAICLIQSLASGFGAKILEPATGILAQSRGGGFVLDPDHPNVLAPGKLPAHTLMPVMAHRAGALAAVSATMGGYAHPQINAMSLVRAFDLGLGALDAVSGPRWLAGGMEPVGPDPFVVSEPEAVRAVGPALAAAGFRVDELPERSEEVGHAQLVLARPDGVFEAAADPRSDGGAAAG